MGARSSMGRELLHWGALLHGREWSQKNMFQSIACDPFPDSFDLVKSIADYENQGKANPSSLLPISIITSRWSLKPTLMKDYR